MNTLEVMTRTLCTQCNGSGVKTTEAEARAKAREHNEAASRVHFPNFLSYKDFLYCDTCKGEGKVEHWVPFETLVDKYVSERIFKM